MRSAIERAVMNSSKAGGRSIARKAPSALGFPKVASARTRPPKENAVSPAAPPPASDAKTDCRMAITDTM